MIRQAHLQSGNPEPRDPFAKPVLPVPFGVPVGKDEDCRAFRGLDRRLPTSASRPEACVDGIVLRPGGFDCARESKDILVVEMIVGGRCSRIPVATIFNGVSSVCANEASRIRFLRRAAHVLEPPMERLDAAIVVGGPAAMLVAADVALEEVHEETVYSRPFHKKS